MKSLALVLMLCVACSCAQADTLILTHGSESFQWVGTVKALFLSETPTLIFAADSATGDGIFYSTFESGDGGFWVMSADMQTLIWQFVSTCEASATGASPTLIIIFQCVP
jgi:hypothetical protein